MISVEALRRCELFSELNDEELGLIAPLCRERVYEAGETICAEQEAAEELYILQEGRVAVHIHLRSAMETAGAVTIEEVEPGRIFGWSSLVKQQRFTASARALERVKVIAIRGSDLNALFDQHTHIGFVVMKQLANVISSRLRHTRTELEKRTTANN